MTDKTKKMIVFANWKIYMKSAGEVRNYVNVLRNELKTFDREALEVHIMTDFLSLAYVCSNLSGTGIKTGVQDIFWEDRGPYAGEVSPLMLKDLGCSSAYLGHSERKTYFGENDENINKKVHACLRNNITPLIFIGETKDELDRGMTEAVLKSQLKACLNNVSADVLEDTVLIYEPRWAIGQKESAPLETISAMHLLTRKLLSGLYGRGYANQMQILYGGSVNLDNIQEILSIKEVDGIGASRAAIDPNDFVKLVRITEKEAVKRKTSI